MPDTYWSDVVFLSGFEGGTVIDESPLAQTVSLSGTTAASSAQAKFGSQSLAHPAAGGMASVPDHASFPSGTTPFTIEGWFYWTAKPAGTFNYLVCQHDGTLSPGWYLKWSNNAGVNRLTLDANDVSGGMDAVAWGTFDPALNTWHHCVAEFNGTHTRIYANGAMIGKYTFLTDLVPSSAALSLGAQTDNGVVAYNDAFPGYMDEVRVTVGTARYDSDAGYTVPTAAFERGAPAAPTIEADATDGVTISEETMFGGEYNDTLTDGVTVEPATATIHGHGAACSDTLTVAEAVVALSGVVVTERLLIGLDQITNHHAQYSLAESIALVDAIYQTIPIELLETINVSLAETVGHAVTVIEALGLVDAIAPILSYNFAINETVAIADSLANFFAVEATDSLTVAVTVGGAGIFASTIDESLAVSDAIAPQMLFRLTVEEGIEIEDVDVLNMIYSGTIADGIEISAAYLSPDTGTVTTWVMNTRTAAVTEYDNYAFNSFARMGNKYLGAADDGLYELVGDDDAGDLVVAEIKSGFAQWAGSRFTMFKGIYLGARGGGDFVLKLTTGDGKTYHYGVAARDMRSTKVKVGKGLRSRYFAFELISSGQDFDLDTIEFVPLVAERRV